MSQYMMPDNENILIQVAKRYESIQPTPASLATEIFHYHERNPDRKLHIKLLKEAAQYIQKKMSPESYNITQLGVLSLLKALLTDPNPEDKIYSYLAEDLNLNNEITHLLQQEKPKIEIDLTDPRYLKVSKEAFEACKSILEADVFKENFPPAFLKDVFGTIATEIDYIDRVLKSLKVSGAKP